VAVGAALLAALQVEQLSFDTKIHDLTSLHAILGLVALVQWLMVSARAVARLTPRNLRETIVYRIVAAFFYAVSTRLEVVVGAVTQTAYVEVRCDVRVSHYLQYARQCPSL
jgi:hypothetical protein